MVTNDTEFLTPNTSINPPTLEFEFPGLQIGIAQYDEGPTGCTVFHFPKGVATAVDIRGGHPGTTGGYDWNNAICFAGGSLYGLEAVFGVTAELFAMRDYSTKWDEIALVSGAIIYDYDPRETKIYPDKALGRAAMHSAREGIFPLGRQGAGRSATCGWHPSEPSGQGGAFRQIRQTRIVVFSVVNSMGVIVNRQGEVVRGNLDAQTGQRNHHLTEIECLLAGNQQITSRRGNTTLTLVVTNQKLNRHELEQLGRQVHNSMGRAIQPFHTIDDGDVLYAASTLEVENSFLDVTALGVFASEVAWDAVLSSVNS